MSCRLFYFMLTLFLVATGGCAGPQSSPPQTPREEGLNIVTSTSVFADLATNVVGEKGVVEYIVPRGQEPEEFEPRPSDFRKIKEADLIFLNGHGLESWIEKLLGDTQQEKLVYLTAGAPTLPLQEKGKAGRLADPHLWLDAGLVSDYYIQNILDALNGANPVNQSYFRKKAQSYIAELKELDRWIKTATGAIPPSNRFIAVSENAFKYYGEAYGFETEGIWELNSHQEGTPRQISRLVDLVRENEVPALFIESTVNPKFMEAVSFDTGVPIKGEVYTDGLGPEGSGAETYVKMMRRNTEMFVKGLGAEQ